jgi:hypothetical protein
MISADRQSKTVIIYGVAGQVIFNAYVDDDVVKVMTTAEKLTAEDIQHIMYGYSFLYQILHMPNVGNSELQS